MTQNLGIVKAKVSLAEGVIHFVVYVAIIIGYIASTFLEEAPAIDGGAWSWTAVIQYFFISAMLFYGLAIACRTGVDPVGVFCVIGLVIGVTVMLHLDHYVQTTRQRNSEYSSAYLNNNAVKTARLTNCLPRDLLLRPSRSHGCAAE